MIDAYLPFDISLGKLDGFSHREPLQYYLWKPTVCVPDLESSNAANKYGNTCKANIS